MAITGISAISGEQIIAAGAVSAREAATASFTTGGNDIQNLYDTVSTNSASWTASGPSYTGDAQGALDEVYSNSADWNSAAAMNELPVSAGEGMDIQNVDGNIVFSCTGGSVPEGVLVESGLEYDNIEISGYSGSAFKDVALSETVATNSGAWGGVALPISAGPGVNVELTDGKLLFSTDETVLWSGSEYLSIQTHPTINDIHIDSHQTTSGNGTQERYDLFTVGLLDGVSNAIRFNHACLTAASHTKEFHVSGPGQHTLTGTSIQTATCPSLLVKIVGINRTVGGN